MKQNKCNLNFGKVIKVYVAVDFYFLEKQSKKIKDLKKEVDALKTELEYQKFVKKLAFKKLKRFKSITNVVLNLLKMISVTQNILGSVDKTVNDFRDKDFQDTLNEYVDMQKKEKISQ